MDYIYKNNDIVANIEKYMNDKGEYLMDRLANIIKKFEVSKTKKTEEDFKMEFTPIINEVANGIGVEFDPNYEKNVKSGRMDCFYGCINLEYKVPGAIESQNHYPARRSSNIGYIEEVQRQISGYAMNGNIDKSRILGIIFDGKYIIYTYYLTNDWYISCPHLVTTTSLESFFVKLFSSEIKGRAVSVSNLIEDFGYTSNLSIQIINVLYNKLIDTNNEKIKLLFNEWKSLFREVSGYNTDTLKLDIDEIYSIYGITEEKLQIDYLIFSIHTYYAILIKFLVTELLNQKKMKINVNSEIRFDTKENTLIELKKIESGLLFRQFGIKNFIEDDFFSWYLEEWDENIYLLIRDFLYRINIYNFSDTLYLDDNGSQDLLRKLYNYLMPKSLRHSLGEYYSPNWLAQYTYINSEINGNANSSVLDPTCGSGTFINIAISNIIDRNRNTDKRELLNSILKNVHGFDLNPLAVITARANYLLALGELINYSDESIEIPIYHCDAMLTILEHDLKNHKVKKVSTRAGVFEIPLELCKDKELLYKTLDYMENYALQRKSINIADMFEKLGVKEKDEELDELVTSFYKQICYLQEKQILHVWIQIIKNAFIPLFHDKVDYIIGNPPWINWQTLPEDYRESIHKHWYDYKIFDFTGLRARLGNAHDDISVLLTYVVIDNFLKDNGKLAFIINQNLLQAYGGGDGFRKFMIKENIPVKVLKVDDFVEVGPFLSSGASNKTAVIYLQKGKKTKYPVKCNKWTKINKGTIDSEDALESVLTKIEFVSLEASPVNPKVYNSSWMIGTHEKLQQFKKLFGKSKYIARKGVDTSANGIFWVEKKNELRGKYIIRNTPENSKKKISQFEGALEPIYLYPMVRGKDLGKWKYACPYYVIIPYESTMKKVVSKEVLRDTSENLYNYFYNSGFNPHSDEFIHTLSTRGTYLKHYQNTDVPEYVLYNIGEYTSAPYKVIWKALASKGMEACVIGSKDGKLVIPDHNNVMIPFENEDEAFFVCGIINSKIVGEFIDSYIAWFKSNHILENINIPEYDASIEWHKELSELSKEAHRIASNNKSTQIIEQKIEDIVKKILLNKD